MLLAWSFLLGPSHRYLASASNRRHKWRVGGVENLLHAADRACNHGSGFGATHLRPREHEHPGTRAFKFLTFVRLVAEVFVRREYHPTPRNDLRYPSVIVRAGREMSGKCLNTHARPLENRGRNLVAKVLVEEIDRGFRRLVGRTPIGLPLRSLLLAGHSPRLAPRVCRRQ